LYPARIASLNPDPVIKSPLVASSPPRAVSLGEPRDSVAALKKKEGGRGEIKFPEADVSFRALSALSNLKRALSSAANRRFLQQNWSFRSGGDASARHYFLIIPREDRGSNYRA